MKNHWQRSFTATGDNPLGVREMFVADVTGCMVVTRIAAIRHARLCSAETSRRSTGKESLSVVGVVETKHFSFVIN